jgi:hypothetical protein
MRLSLTIGGSVFHEINDFWRTNMTREEFEELLKYPEDVWLDWKKDFPVGLLKNSSNPEWKKGKSKLLKALVSIANRDDERTGFLVYGVEDNNTHRIVVGISKSWDDADFQSWAKIFYPHINFLYSELEWENKKILGIFKIYLSQEYPHVACENIGEIHEGQVWFRRGSKNTVALFNDLKNMFRGNEPLKMDRLYGETPIFDRAKSYYESLGYEVCWPLLREKDNRLVLGYKIAYYPDTRREIWAGYDSRTGQYEHILMLKPKDAE